MKSGHDEIKGLLPEYLKGSLPEYAWSEIEVHLKDCKDCRDEMFFISELIAVEVPDPGELFWKTLPLRVRVSVKGKTVNRFSLKTLFFRPLSIAATMAALLLMILVYTKRDEMPGQYNFFRDPLTVSSLEYGDLTEKDIPLITERSEVDMLALHSESYAGYSYHTDFASLSSKELDGLYEALKKEQKIGG